MSLIPSFELTPRQSYFDGGPTNWAMAWVYGISFRPPGPWAPYSFDHQHAEDELFFSANHPGDPSINQLTAPQPGTPVVHFLCDLSVFGAGKELALVFGFDAETESRVQLYSLAGLVGDETLKVGDKQLLILLEDLEFPVTQLLFYHVKGPGGTGGDWFWKGFTGYVI